MTHSRPLFHGIIQTDFTEEPHMKIDRLIGILSILLQKETVTAPALAEQLCRTAAGRPLVSERFFIGY